MGAARMLLMLPLLTGCTALGGNIKGNFLCRAPGGICAPTARIDEQALAAMDLAERTEPELAAAALPKTHSEQALKVVLPQRQDRFGRWHASQVVYIEPDPAAKPTDPGRPVASAQPSLSELAVAAPTLSAFEEVPGTGPTASIRARVEATLGGARAGDADQPAQPALPVSHETSGGPATPPAAPLAAPPFPASQTSGGR